MDRSNEDHLVSEGVNSVVTSWIVGYVQVTKHRTKATSSKRSRILTRGVEVSFSVLLTWLLLFIYDFTHLLKFIRLPLVRPIFYSAGAQQQHKCLHTSVTMQL